MVRGEGLEPSRPFEQDILSVSWLPITTPARISLSCFFHDELAGDCDNLGIRF